MKHLSPAGLRAPERKDGDTAEEVAKALEELTQTVTERLEAGQKAIDDLHAKMNRQGLGGASNPLGSLPIDDRFAAKADPVAERKAYAAFIRGGSDEELKAVSMSVGVDPAGGYFVTPVRSAAMTKRLFDLSPIARLARNETMGTGDAFEEIDDRDEVDAVWVGEKESRPKTDAAQIGEINIPLHEIYANVCVTQRLLDDASMDVGAWTEGKIADKFGRKEGASFVTGDGIRKPKGFLAYPTATTGDLSRPRGTLQYFKSGGASGFAASDPADALKSLVWGLRAPYRKDAVWLMNSTTASLIDKFKNGQGDYIWRDGMTAGAPPSLLGYPVEFDENMPDVEAGAFPIAFANMKLAYCIISRPGIKSLRDPYTDKPNVLFYQYRRVGGGVTNDDCIKLLKIAA